MSQRSINFVTSNAKKLEEVRTILGSNFPLELVNHKLDLPEIQGELDEVSIRKCQEAARCLKGSVLVEDTSLCFDALKGLPGPYITCFFQKLGSEGLTKLLTGWKNKSAKSVCTLAYCTGQCEDLDVKLFQGITNGKIVSPRGTRDYSWDCIFQPDGYSETYAELGKTEKNKIFHRYKAIVKFKKYVFSK